MTNSEVVSNTAFDGGGLLAVGTSITGSNNQILLNQAQASGGGAALTASSLTLGGNSEFAANSAATGGGLFLRTNASPHTVGGSSATPQHRLHFSDNTATGNGGAIAVVTVMLVGAAGPATLRNLRV